MDPQHLLVKIVKILNSLKIPYLITGGMAIYVWGRPRFTADIDLVVELFDYLREWAKKLNTLGVLEEQIGLVASKD